MLKLADFYHLPELEAAVAQLLADASGMVVVAGLDPRPSTGDSFLPSGRATIFRIMLGELLEARPRSRAIVVAQDRDVVRVPRGYGRRVTFELVQPPLSYADQIRSAAARRPDLLVIDRLCAETVRPALAAAHSGLRVLAQLDTIFRGAGVARQLVDLGAPPEALEALSSVVAVQRLATLCTHCRSEMPVPPELLRRLPASLGAEATVFYRSGGCDQCAGSGRSGDIALFDVFRPAGGSAEGRTAAGATPLALEDYALALARQGYLAAEDVLELGEDQLRRTYRLLTSSEEALTRANADLERKVVELESANRVLQQRTAALISLQDIGNALISSASLADLVGRVCRRARELCGADRAILYLRREPDVAEVLAVSGWSSSLIHQRLPAVEVFGEVPSDTPQPYPGWPPGVPPRHADVEGGQLRAGLHVPLVAQNQHVGLMIVHTTLKARFAPAEVALLYSFANQAALSIQRARLVDELREKIAMLEQAQAGLVAKERLEREMELAREVQQSVLPRVFPPVPGFAFAARNAPARQVGGDFYDVFQLDAERFGVVIADVSGKGMPAALYMALARSLLLAEARREPSPRAALLNVNRLLRELGEPHMFVTVFYGVVHATSGELVYCRAGHDYPVLLRAGDIRTLESEGTVLGFFAERELHLSEACLILQPGDRLVLYTDGLTDVMDGEGRRYEFGRLRELFAAHAALGAEALVDATLTTLAAYQGSAPQYDDMTMLVVEVTARD
jgi:serine phosphatase RsbU (regulator of sigma subunit)